MNLYATPQGYRYFRCRAGGTDDTVYEHQLVKIASGTDPCDVFDPENHVHHRNAIPWDNRPENLEVRNRRDHGHEHRREQLSGRPA